MLSKKTSKAINTVKIAVLAVAMAFTGAATASAGETFDAVKKRGMINCGVNTSLIGFSSANSKGEWVGLDVDVCRAMAAAIFGDAKKVKFIPLSGQQRFTALQSGEIDVLSRNTTATLSRDTKLGLNFGPVVYYDGAGFLVHNSLGVMDAKDLEGAAICVQQGTTTELNLADYFRSNKMSYKAIVIENVEEVSKAFFSGRCDVLCADQSALAAERSKAKDPNKYSVLPQVISKEPLGPAVRHGDDQWLDIVKWSMVAMVNAEELGIDSKNVDEKAKSSDPRIARLLGGSGELGDALGVPNSWAFDIIKQVGNYGESYVRNVGTGSPLGLPRGVNELWTKGGIMYGPPIR